MTPNDLDIFKVKNTNMHAIYTPGAQIFISFTLLWAVFELRTFFSDKYTKITSNDLLKVKNINIIMHSAYNLKARLLSSDHYLRL